MEDRTGGRREVIMTRGEGNETVGTEGDKGR
jgi:hypothetical protein